MVSGGLAGGAPAKKFSIAYNGKKIFTQDGGVFCNQHNRPLNYKAGAMSPFHKCDQCKYFFIRSGSNAKYFECRDCDLDFCETCIHNVATYPNNS